MVKGLSSARKAARQGYAVTLAHLLKNFIEISNSAILDLIKENLAIKGSFKGQVCHFLPWTILNNLKMPFCYFIVKFIKWCIGLVKAEKVKRCKHNSPKRACCDPIWLKPLLKTVFYWLNQTVSLFCYNVKLRFCIPIS